MEIKKEDIPENMLNMVEIIGIEKFIKISKIYGGYSIYIPYYKSLEKEARNREIIKDYNGFNVRELAEIYNLSVSQVHRITKDQFSLIEVEKVSKK